MSTALLSHCSSCNHDVHRESHSPTHYHAAAALRCVRLHSAPQSVLRSLTDAAIFTCFGVQRSPLRMRSSSRARSSSKRRNPGRQARRSSRSSIPARAPSWQAMVPRGIAALVSISRAISRSISCGTRSLTTKQRTSCSMYSMLTTQCGNFRGLL
jgi:hypothetical protein